MCSKMYLLHQSASSDLQISLKLMERLQKLYFPPPSILGFGGDFWFLHVVYCEILLWWESKPLLLCNFRAVIKQRDANTLSQKTQLLKNRVSCCYVMARWTQHSGPCLPFGIDHCCSFIAFILDFGQALALTLCACMLSAVFIYSICTVF